ncbi:MAG: undecaprenyl-diphosphate phosphatase [Parcubacteria group bacterium]|nr:undecaprenyl-diphosphate phosphatase [Parcubacteria group bacterium]
MLTIFQSFILGLLQGVTELFPISSLGHSVILPSLLHWQLDQKNPEFVTFIIVTHLATAIVLLVYFWSDWKKIIWSMIQSLRLRTIHNNDAKVGWLIVVASIPVGVLGILFEKQFSALFALPLFAGIFLIGNGLMLYGAERLISRIPKQETFSNERIAQMTWKDAVKVGCMQCLALFPGFSRTGASLVGGLFSGLSREDAVRFSFLLATPIIFAAAVLKIPELTLSGQSVDFIPFIIGAVTAAIGAYFSVRFLTKYFETKTLVPFAWYCVFFGALAVIVNL